MKKALLVGMIAIALFAGMPAAQTMPYENESNETGQANWTQDHDQPTLTNITHYVSRISTFVVGDDPTDPGVGPIFIGLLVGGMSIQLLGQSRTGLVASGTMGTMVIAALSSPGSAGFLPRWVYGSIVMLIALIAGVVYIKMMR